MLKLNKFIPNIEVRLDNGIYIFDMDSGTGKTWLCKMLRQYQLAGEPVASYTYQDKQIGLDFDKVVKPTEQKLLMIDRYDMYRNQYNDIIRQFAETGIVLIDCKTPIALPCNTCSIDISEELLEVE